MNTAELKSEIHRLVVETEDLDILEKVKLYFTGLTSGNDDWWETISEQEKTLINKGLEDVEAGRLVPYSEVKEKVNKTIQKHTNL